VKLARRGVSFLPFDRIGSESDATLLSRVETALRIPPPPFSGPSAEEPLTAPAPSEESGRGAEYNNPPLRLDAASYAAWFARLSADAPDRDV
jgi:hypothetical protein